jgi:hypothetical protein
MLTFAERGKPAGAPTPTSLVRRAPASSLRRFQPAIEDRAVQRLPHAAAGDLEVDCGTTAAGRFGHDFSQVPADTQAPPEEGAGPSPALDIGGQWDLRARVSAITGIDVRGVPVEAGDARPWRAMTHEGRVTLGTQATQHDLAHELTHAAQQRSPSGAWLGAGEAERRADRVASAALEGESASVAVGRVPSAAVLGAGERYIRELPTPLPPPPANLTTDSLKVALNDKVAMGVIKAYGVKGVNPGDPEERFLYYALVRVVESLPKGAELDLITSIGAGKGEVTVRVDARGRADAELVGKSVPTVPATFNKVEEASAALKDKYKLEAVKGEGGKQWRVDELNKVFAAWERLKPREAAALERYTLIRTRRIVLEDEPNKLLEGLTTTEELVPKGATKATVRREIRFADQAFEADEAMFIGGDVAGAAPASYEVFIHEVGHALARKPYHDLHALAAADLAKRNQAEKDAHDAQVATIKAFKAALGRKYAKHDLDLAQALLGDVSAALKALQAFEQHPDDDHQKAAEGAISNRDATKASIAADNKVVAGLGPAVTAQDKYLAALKKFLEATDAMAASEAKAEELKSGSITKRLQAFIDFVNEHQIPPPTEYAARRWPKKPEEFFVEAFSLWKNDPAFFANYSPKLKGWFDAGEHLK